MSLKYKIFPQQSLLVDVLATSITASKLYEFHETYRNDPDILCVEKVLTNLIDAEFKMSFDEMNEYIGIVVREKTPPNLKWALLTESPNSTMFSMLLMCLMLKTQVTFSLEISNRIVVTRHIYVPAVRIME